MISKTEQLAIKLKEIYPKGKKPGTNYYFCSNVKEVVLKLNKFFKIYGEYTDEEIIDATQRYIDSFQEDFTYMRLLKYFIYKESDNGGISELATLLENKDFDEEQGTFIIN